MNIPEQLTGLADRPQTWWSEAPQPQKIGAIGGAVVLVVGLAIAFMSGGDEGDWDAAILYANLDYAEAAEVTTRLVGMGYQYKLTEDASTITVPKDDVRQLRLMLAGEGFPKSGHIGYEIFDDAQLAMTDFLQRVNLVRALQGELEQTLGELDGVRTARVHLVTPEPSLFTEEQNPVTAAVTLTLVAGFDLKPRQIEAVGYLIASSVEGLDIANVVIVDSEGNMLSEERDPLAKAASRQFEQQQQVERVLERKVQTLMDEVIGANRSRVRINVLLDFSQKTTQSSAVVPGEGGRSFSVRRRARASRPSRALKRMRCATTR